MRQALLFLCIISSLVNKVHGMDTTENEDNSVVKNAPTTLSDRQMQAIADRMQQDTTHEPSVISTGQEERIFKNISQEYFSKDPTPTAVSEIKSGFTANNSSIPQPTLLFAPNRGYTPNSFHSGANHTQDKTPSIIAVSAPPIQTPGRNPFDNQFMKEIQRQNALLQKKTEHQQASQAYFNAIDNIQRYRQEFAQQQQVNHTQAQETITQKNNAELFMMMHDFRARIEERIHNDIEILQKGLDKELKEYDRLGTRESSTPKTIDGSVFFVDISVEQYKNSTRIAQLQLQIEQHQNIVQLLKHNIDLCFNQIIKNNQEWAHKLIQKLDLMSAEERTTSVQALEKQYEQLEQQKRLQWQEEVNHTKAIQEVNAIESDRFYNWNWGAPHRYELAQRRRFHKEQLRLAKIQSQKYENEQKIIAQVIRHHENTVRQQTPNDQQTNPTLAAEQKQKTIIQAHNEPSLQSLDQEIKTNDIVTKQYSLLPSVEKIFHDAGWQLPEEAQFTGNMQQHALYAQNYDLLNQIGLAYHLAQQHKAAHPYLLAARDFSLAALDATKNNKLQEARGCTQFARALLFEVGHELKEAFFTDLKILKGLTVGTAKGSYNAVKGLYEMVFHPIRFGQSIGTLWNKIVVEEYYSSEMISKAFEEWKHQPLDKQVENITEFVVSTVATAKLPQKILTAFDSLSVVLEAETAQLKKLQNAETALEAKQIADKAPVAVALLEEFETTAQIEKACCKYKHQPRVINPEIVNRIKKAAQNTEFTIEETLQFPCGKRSKDTLRHIILGEVYKKKVSGMHHGHKFPELFITESNPDPMGIYKVRWARNGTKEKLSSCVPKDWDLVQHADAIWEAFYNPIQPSKVNADKTLTIVGQSKSGVVFGVVAELTADAPELIIKTAYPIHNHPLHLGKK